MKKEKLFYEAPDALTVPLRPRRVMCQSTGEQVNESQDWDGIDEWS